MWMPEHGVGYYPVSTGAIPYDVDYFDRYARQADTDLGRSLMSARVDFVDRHWRGGLVDVGIGSGAFIEARLPRGPTFGYDVNPVAVDWLSERGLLVDPYMGRVPAVSLWDVLEHIPDFPQLLTRVTHWVFTSLPVFSGPDHVLRSKHYRKDEHCWYFTSEGLVRVMAGLNFECVECNQEETLLGREDIKSFAFRRLGAAINWRDRL